jgi:hypothetical protein
MIRDRFFNSKIGVSSVLQDFSFVGVGQDCERMPVLWFWGRRGADITKTRSLTVRGLQYVFTEKTGHYFQNKSDNIQDIVAFVLVAVKYFYCCFNLLNFLNSQGITGAV